MEDRILYFVLDWYGDKDFARVVTSSRHLTRFGEGEMARTYTDTRSVRKQKRYVCAQSTWKVTKVGSEDRLVQKFELKNGFGGVNYQIHQKATNMRHQTNESDEDDFDQPQRNHGQTDHGIKEIILCKVIGNIMAGDILKICGTHQKTTLGGFVQFPLQLRILHFPA